MKNNDNGKYHAFKIPRKLGEEVLKEIQDHPLGYRSKTEYIIAAIREKMNRENNKNNNNKKTRVEDES